MATTSVSPATWTGVARSPFRPSPSSPERLSPQLQTVPFALRAREWISPAETATISDNPATGTGLLRSVVVPSPSCPWLLFPQAQTEPSLLTAREWDGPAE